MDASFRKLYTDVIRRLCDSWTYNCDGGCYESLTHRIVWTEGPWTFVYQPKKGFDEYDTSEISLFFTHKDHKVLDPKFVRETIQPVIDAVHSEFESNFQKLMDLTGHQWLEPIRETSVYEILQFEPWTVSQPDKKRFKTTYSLRGSDDSLSCGDYKFSLPGFAGDTGTLEDLLRTSKKPVQSLKK